LAQGKIESLSDLSDTLEALTSKINPAVVQVISTGYQMQTSGAGAGFITRQRSGGSGVIVDPSGYIVTNRHVIRGLTKIQVVLAVPKEVGGPGSSILKARGEIHEAAVIGSDLETDLAVLKIESEGLPYLGLGDSETIRQGQIVLALGSPLGLDNSVSMGVVSAVARQLRPEDPMIYIQTDASINPGNSGGPLVDTDGNVVGINTLIFSKSGGSEGLGFAAPSNIVRTVYEQIRENGRVPRGQIGVVAQTITPLIAAGLGLQQDWGVILADVLPGGPAQMAGLAVGDVVLTMDAKPMENARQFNVNLYQHKVGDTVFLQILRGADKNLLRVPVIERTDVIERFASMVTPEQNLVGRLGILGIEVDADIAQMLSSERKLGGVLVAALSPNAVGATGSFLPGDIIYELNKTSITNLRLLRETVAGLKEGDPVVAQVLRDGSLLYAAFEM
jgi:serine protease Do